MDCMLFESYASRDGGSQRRSFLFSGGYKYWNNGETEMCTRILRGRKHWSRHAEIKRSILTLLVGKELFGFGLSHIVIPR